MKDQINTIREALNLALTWHDAKYEHPFIKQALTALAQLEAMVGKQEPVGRVDGEGHVTWFAPIPEGGANLYAAPVAQQPQVIVDMVPPATARDRWMYEQGRLAERDPRTHTAQQSQAEPFGYVSQHTNGTWEFSPTPAGVYPDTAKSITAVYAKQPQAKPHKPLFADLIAQHPGLREELLEMDKQPQAEPTDSMGIPLSCGKPLCSPGDHHPLCKLHKKPQAEAVPDGWYITERRDGGTAKQWPLTEQQTLAVALPQQAEVVPPGYVLVPIDVLEAASESLGSFVSDEGWTSIDMQAMDNLDAILAQQKGQP